MSCVCVYREREGETERQRVRERETKREKLFALGTWREKTDWGSDREIGGVVETVHVWLAKLHVWLPPHGRRCRDVCV